MLEVVRHESAGGRTLIEVHFAFVGSVSAAVRRVIDPKKLSWVTRTEVFPDGGTGNLDCATGPLPGPA